MQLDNVWHGADKLRRDHAMTLPANTVFKVTREGTGKWSIWRNAPGLTPLCIRGGYDTKEEAIEEATELKADAEADAAAAANELAREAKKAAKKKGPRK